MRLKVSKAVAIKRPTWETGAAHFARGSSEDPLQSWASALHTPGKQVLSAGYMLESPGEAPQSSRSGGQGAGTTHGLGQHLGCGPEQ